MFRKSWAILLLVAAGFLIAGTFWDLPHSKVIMFISGVICSVSGIYEALRPNPAKRGQRL